MSATEFMHDAFLSQSAKDKAVVGPLAERLDELKPRPTSKTTANTNIG